MSIDLHLHSTFSDGTCSPEELIDAAIEAGLQQIALCDHDTTDGLQRFLAAGVSRQQNVVPGIELSAQWHDGHCHILGYGLLKKNERLEAVLQETRDSRSVRNKKILERLETFGLSVQYEELLAFAQGDVVGRLHIAGILALKGYVRDAADAFARFLMKGKPAYVDRFRLQPEDAVRLLADAGAIVVMAHPSQLRRSAGEIDKLVKRLLPNGLKGIEVYTPHASDDDIICFELMARQNNLMITGGSDFHGINKPAHRLGHYRHDKKIPLVSIPGL